MVAIIGILAAVAIPQYQNYVARAQVSEALSLASGAKTAVAEYFNMNGTFPADNTMAGLSDAADISGKYVESVTVADGVITARFSSGAHAKLDGGSMALTAVDNGGSIGWSCSSSDISDYLPSSCAEVTGTTIKAASSASVPVAEGPTAWEDWYSGKAWVKGTKDKLACWDKDYGDSGGWVETLSRHKSTHAAHKPEFFNAQRNAADLGSRPDNPTSGRWLPCFTCGVFCGGDDL